MREIRQPRYNVCVNLLIVIIPGYALSPRWNGWLANYVDRNATTIPTGMTAMSLRVCISDAVKSEHFCLQEWAEVMQRKLASCYQIGELIVSPIPSLRGM